MESPGIWQQLDTCGRGPCNLGARSGSSRYGRRRLKLTESLLEAVEVAAREILGLLDDPVARDASAERAELPIQTLNLCGRQMRNMFEVEKAESVQRFGEFGPDALHPAKIVAGFALTVELSVNAGAKKFAGDVARRCCGFSGDTAGLGGSGLRHVRPDWGTVGQLHSLARPQQHDRDDAGNRNDEDEPPIFADEVHYRHQFHCALYLRRSSTR